LKLLKTDRTWLL